MEIDDSTNSRFVWTTNDCMGKAVKLKAATFNEHIIVEGKRNELIGEENTLKRIVEAPRIIVSDNDHEDRIIYGDIAYLTNLNDYHFVEVCAEKCDDHFDVVTAITMRKIRSYEGRRIIYDSKKQNT